MTRHGLLFERDQQLGRSIRRRELARSWVERSFESEIGVELCAGPRQALDVEGANEKAPLDREAVRKVGRPRIARLRIARWTPSM